MLLQTLKKQTQFMVSNVEPSNSERSGDPYGCAPLELQTGDQSNPIYGEQTYPERPVVSTVEPSRESRTVAKKSVLIRPLGTPPGVRANSWIKILKIRVFSPKTPICPKSKG
jgi:hypothetical protein